MHEPLPEYDPDRLRAEAERFVRRCYAELGREEEVDSRLAEIDAEIDERGHYEHTFAELEHGARMAWRNSNRCIGRLFWHTLHVRDERGLEEPAPVHEACLDHLEYAENDGDVRPTITVFKPRIRGEQRLRIWNYQLVRYAGYREGGTIVGDPDSVAFTDYCRSRGWEGTGTEFDVLPHVIQAGDREPELFEVPEGAVTEVPMSHPEYPWFAELGLRWYAVPVVSNMRLEIGGIQYTAAPFNGWYVATEIGARNFADEDRYDRLPEIATRLGLDTSRNRTLWKDEALVELNRAVLHSYADAGVRIVDHHSAAEEFAQFEALEAASGRTVTGDWSWLIPPISPATTHVFHETYDDEVRTPNYFYQEPPYADG